jgi:hypothetical protein
MQREKHLLNMKLILFLLSTEYAAFSNASRCFNKENCYSQLPVAKNEKPSTILGNYDTSQIANGNLLKPL